jgi:hypothetical protein
MRKVEKMGMKMRTKMRTNKIVLSSNHLYNETVTFAIRKKDGKFRS